MQNHAKKESTLCHAWILDAAVNQDGILLWLKLENEEVISALMDFHPAFYVAFSDPDKITREFAKTNDYFGLRTLDDYYEFYAQKLREHPDIESVALSPRRIKAEDSVYSTALQIAVRSPFRFKKIINEVRQMELFTFYNSDLPIAQMFFYETSLFPFAYCQVKYCAKNSHKSTHYQVEEILLEDSNESIHYELPPLRVVWLDVEAHVSRIQKSLSDPLKACILTVDACSTAIPLQKYFNPQYLSKFALDTDDNSSDTEPVSLPQLRIVGNSEVQIISRLERAIKKIDPDIIFTAKGDEQIFPYLLARAAAVGKGRSFSVSRDGTPLRYTSFNVSGADSYMSYGTVYHRSNTQFYLNGRLHIDSAIMGGLHFDSGNLYGIVEVARISFITLQRLTRVTIGGALQSMQFFHANTQGVLVPEEKKNSEFFRDGAALLHSDRGGHIFNPRIGLYNRVAELDFTSMYPALMVQYNVSPEMLNCSCCAKPGDLNYGLSKSFDYGKQDNSRPTAQKVPGLEYYICVQRKGVVPLSLRLPLKKRIKYKELALQSAGKEAQRYQKIQEALKWILVVCFGYLGFRNARFGRIEAHQTVCAYSREFLLNAAEIVEHHKLKIIHGIVDSLYVQAPPSMSTDEFHRICQVVVQEIIDKTHIPISYDPAHEYFDSICFLPTKADPEVGALNRYWGMKPNGGMKVRGVEIRRHDTPPLIKQFQIALIQRLSQIPEQKIVNMQGKDPETWNHALRSEIVPLLLEYYRYLETGKVSVEELAITIRLTRMPRQYKVKNYQAIAAARLEKMGIPLSPGMKVSFIIINDKAHNPDERVIPLMLFNKKKRSYDLLKYKELLVRALANLLPFPISDSFRKHLILLGSNQNLLSSSTQVNLERFLHLT